MIRRHNNSMTGVTPPKRSDYDGGSVFTQEQTLVYPYMDIAPVSRQTIEERQRGFCPTGNVTCFDCNDSPRQEDNIRCVTCEWRHSQRVNAR